jgi:hypothetical protein
MPETRLKRVLRRINLPLAKNGNTNSSHLGLTMRANKRISGVTATTIYLPPEAMDHLFEKNKDLISAWQSALDTVKKRLGAGEASMCALESLHS